MTIAVPPPLPATKSVKTSVSLVLGNISFYSILAFAPVFALLVTNIATSDKSAEAQHATETGIETLFCIACVGVSFVGGIIGLAVRKRGERLALFMNLAGVVLPAPFVLFFVIFVALLGHGVHKTNGVNQTFVRVPYPPTIARPMGGAHSTPSSYIPRGR